MQQKQQKQQEQQEQQFAALLPVLPMLRVATRREGWPPGAKNRSKMAL